MEENAQEAARKERRKQRGKQHKYQHKYHTFPYQNQNFISISRKNIVPLAMGRARGNRENSFSERDEHRTPTLRNTAENRTLCWMTSNSMNDVSDPNAISGNERRIISNKVSLFDQILLFLLSSLLLETNVYH